MIMEKFKRMAPTNHSFKTSPHIYNKRQGVYDNKYIVIKILLESINKLFQHILYILFFMYYSLYFFSNYHNFLNLKC